ncbi:MAG: extracellular solute-binding protein [Chloroflexota bacterium]
MNIEEGTSHTVDIPQAVANKTNVAFIYSEPVDPAYSWTYSQELGRQYVQREGENVQTAFIPDVPDTDESIPVIEAVAKEGYDVIITTELGMMNATATVASEFPDTVFINNSGFKTAEPNMGTIFGAMEEAEYLAGMVAGARASLGAARRVGLIAQFPWSETIRHINAVVLGMKRTCPDCVADIGWTFSWEEEDEIAVAHDLMDNGASVIVNNSGSRGPVEAVAQRGLSIILSDSTQACEGIEEFCLGITYWRWGPAYLDIVQAVQADTWTPTHVYPSLADGIVGFYGFMDDQDPLPTTPRTVIPEVAAVLAQMQRGEFTRFDIFRGPIKNNQGELVIPDVTPTQSDLEGLTAEYIAELGVTNREPCTYCMDFLVEGFVPDAFIPKSAEEMTMRTEAGESLTASQEQVIELWTADSNEESIAIYEEVALRYMQENPSVKIVIEPVATADFFDRLELAIALDEMPDIVRVGVERIPVLSAGGLLDQSASENVIDMIGADDFHERTLEMVTDSASFFYAAIPFDGWVQAMWYRKDIFEELNLAPPDTWEAIQEANQQLATSDKVTYGLTLATDPERGYTHQVFEQMAISAGAYPFDGDGHVTMNTPEMIETLRWYASLQDYAVPGPQHAHGAREFYAQDQTGMFIYTTAIIADLAGATTLGNNSKLKITVEDLASKTGFVPRILGPAGPVTYGRLMVLGILTDADPATQDVVRHFMTDGYEDIIAIEPTKKIPARKSFFAKWRNASDYFQDYDDAILETIANSYSTMNRWFLRPGYGTLEQTVIGDLESQLVIPKILYQLVVERVLTPEEAAEQLQSETEVLLAIRIEEQ